MEPTSGPVTASSSTSSPRYDDLRRGDVVVFDGTASFEVAGRSPHQSDRVVGRVLGGRPPLVGVDLGSSDYVKRVVGLPGDRVVCCDAQGRISVNGRPVDGAATSRRATAPVEPPSTSTSRRDRLWLMGDHRSDSRRLARAPRRPRRGHGADDDVIGRRRGDLLAARPARWLRGAAGSQLDSRGSSRRGTMSEDQGAAAPTPAAPPRLAAARVRAARHQAARRARDAWLRHDPDRPTTPGAQRTRRPERERRPPGTPGGPVRGEPTAPTEPDLDRPTVEPTTGGARRLGCLRSRRADARRRGDDQRPAARTGFVPVVKAATKSSSSSSGWRWCCRSSSRRGCCRPSSSPRARWRTPSSSTTGSSSAS